MRPRIAPSGGLPLLTLAVALVLGLTTTACGSSAPTLPADAGVDLPYIGDVGGDHRTTDAGFVPLDGPGGTDHDGGTPPPDAPAGRTLIYAHTDTTLYQVDATQTPFNLTQLGDFDCVGGNNQDPAMTDLAVDKAGNLTGISAQYLYSLTVTSSGVHCDAPVTLQGNGRFYGLTYAPQGVLGADEVLVAANSAGELWAIDGQGQQTPVGTFGNVPRDDGHGHRYPSSNVGQPWELSGDIVFLFNGGDPIGFATVRDCPNPPSSNNCSSVDTLVQIDLTQLRLGNTGSVTQTVLGQIVPASSCPGADFGSFYGIAALQDKVYGFSRKGDVVSINNSDGTGCRLQADPTMKFSGAATTTLAPVIRPHPQG
jgi:hypothetical protein